MEKNAKIFVAGSTGLVGSALVQELKFQGYSNIIAPTRAELDLTNPTEVKWWFSCIEPEYVFFCAARVGGIKDNAANKVEFFLKNMQMEINVISNAADYKCKKLLFVGTSCIYPRDCLQPIREEYLMTGLLEKATEAYSIAKIAGLKLCQYYREQGNDFITALPCNVYGERDHFNEETSHCLPGMLARMHRAKTEERPSLAIWGSASTRREFIYAPDLARALLLVMEEYSDSEPINTGSGLELTMEQLATQIQQVVGYQGELTCDSTQLVGTPRKVLDSSKLRALGWSPQIPFTTALQRTYSWYVAFGAPKVLAGRADTES